MLCHRFCRARWQKWAEKKHLGWLGNLSYPIYLVHVLVKDVVVSWGVRDSNGEIILLATLVVAAAVLHWIEEPLDAWRQKRLTRDPA